MSRLVRVVALFGAVALTACGANGAHRSPDGRIDRTGKLSVFALRVGDCLDPGRALDGEVAKVRAVPCGQPHTHEVYATASVPGGATYPGLAKVKRYADAVCSDRFDAYVGNDYTRSTLLFTYLQPSRTGWTDDHDHRVVCLVVSKSPVAGSLRGSRR